MRPISWRDKKLMSAAVTLKLRPAVSCAMMRFSSLRVHKHRHVFIVVAEIFWITSLILQPTTQLGFNQLHFPDSLGLKQSIGRCCFDECTSVCISICLSVPLSVRPSVCPSVCLSVCLSVPWFLYLSLCLSACIITAVFNGSVPLAKLSVTSGVYKYM